MAQCYGMQEGLLSLDGAVVLLLGLHGKLLCMVCPLAGARCEGLGVVGRRLFATRAVHNRTHTRRQELHTAAAYARHSLSPYARGFARRLDDQIKTRCIVAVSPYLGPEPIHVRIGLGAAGCSQDRQPGPMWTSI